MPVTYFQRQTNTRAEVLRRLRDEEEFALSIFAQLVSRQAKQGLSPSLQRVAHTAWAEYCGLASSREDWESRLRGLAA